MSPATDGTGQDISSDASRAATGRGSREPSDPRVAASGPRRRFRRRIAIGAILVAAVWLVVLRDPRIGPLVVFLLGAFGAALALMGAAMGLGFLGFGLFAALERAIGWIGRVSRWPDE